MTLTHRLLPVLGLLGLMISPLSASAEDADPVKLKLATVAPKSTPWADLMDRYKRSIRKASKKKIKVKVYLGGTKGDEQSIVRQVFKGSLQGGGVSTGAMSALVPELDILELPYLFDSLAEADRILDGPARPLIEKLLEAKGFKLLMYSENGYRSFGTKGGFIKTPADLKAKKMRAQESPVHVEMYRALGAAPVTISVGEVLSSLQTGVVTGFDNTPLFTQAASWNQAIDHFTVSEHIYQPALIFVNLEWFNGLTPDLQAALLKPASKLEKKGRKAVRALNPLLLKNFEKQNVKVYTLTEAEKQVFKDATRKVWDIRRAKASAEGKALLDAILAAKGK